MRFSLPEDTELMLELAGKILKLNRQIAYGRSPNHEEDFSLEDLTQRRDTLKARLDGIKDYFRKQ